MQLEVFTAKVSSPYGDQKILIVLMQAERKEISRFFYESHFYVPTVIAVEV